MTLGPGNRLQSNTGSVTAANFTATLPNPTMDGSTLLLFIGTNNGNLAMQQQSFDPPWVQDAVHIGLDFLWRRDSQPAGETSWVITGSSGSVPWFWRVEEWSGLSTIGQPDANTIVFVGTGSPVSTNTATADVDDFAALAFFRAGSGGGQLWPAARAYPAGWTEVDWLTNGTGATAGDFAMAIAESYPGASGSVQCTITWDTSGGGSVPSGTDAWVGCYQPDVPLPKTTPARSPRG